MQSVLSRIWTRVAVSNSYDDNDYTTITTTLLDAIINYTWLLSLPTSTNQKGLVFCNFNFTQSTKKPYSINHRIYDKVYQPFHPCNLFLVSKWFRAYIRTIDILYNMLYILCTNVNWSRKYEYWLIITLLLVSISLSIWISKYWFSLSCTSHLFSISNKLCFFGRTIFDAENLDFSNKDTFFYNVSSPLVSIRTHLENHCFRQPVIIILGNKFSNLSRWLLAKKSFCGIPHLLKDQWDHWWLTYSLVIYSSCSWKLHHSVWLDAFSGSHISLS